MTAKNHEIHGLRLVLPPELAKLLVRFHTSLASRGYLGSVNDYAREVIARELSGQQPEEVAFALGRIAGSNRGYYFTVSCMKRVAKAIYEFFDRDERLAGVQHCPTCGGPILPAVERVLAELGDTQSMATVDSIRRNNDEVMQAEGGYAPNGGNRRGPR